MKPTSLAWAAFLALAVAMPASALTLDVSAAANVTNDPDGTRSDTGHLLINWANGWENVGLIQFDLSGVGSVSSAVVNLFHDYNQGVDAEFALFRNTSEWVTGTTNWATRPSFDSMPAGTLSLNALSYGENEWFAVDVTATVAGWVDGSYANHGFTLARTDDPNPFLYFQGLGQPNPPTLLRNAVPEPATYGLMLGGLALLGFKLRRRQA